MPTVIKRPVNMTTEVQLRPGAIIAIAALVVVIVATGIGAWESFRAVTAEGEASRLRTENTALREEVARLKGRLEQMDGLFALVGLRKVEQGRGGPAKP